MSTLLSIPVITVLIILQTVVVSHIPLLNGTADLLLVWLGAWALIGKSRNVWIWAGLTAVSIAFVSANHYLVPFISYFCVVFIAKFFQHRIWQSPIIAIFLIVFTGSIVQNLATYLILSVLGTPLIFNVTLVQVMIPSVFLNLFLALPVYAIAKDLYKRILPEEVEE